MLNQVGWQRQKIKKEIHNVLMTFSICLRGLLKNRMYQEGQELSGYTLWEAGPDRRELRGELDCPDGQSRMMGPGVLRGCREEESALQSHHR